MSKAEELIACLEGEIAKRDEELAACRVAVENCEVFRARIVELESAAESLIISRDYHHEQEIEYRRRWAGLCAAPVSEAKEQGVVMPERESFMAGVKAASDKVKAIVEDYDQRHGSTDPDTGTREYPGNGEEWVCCMLELIEDFTGIVAPSSLNAAPVQQVSVPDERIIPTSAEIIQWAWEEEPEETRFQEGYNAAKRWVKMQIEASIAAPSAPAADAGLVDMYRHLQKVTPYRFKKIQDASITDGGDVMYFHKDRFDAALLADMAAHRAKGVV